jgi:phosphoribosylglycinamide formyltransferase 1
VKKIAIFVSGRGSNAVNIIEYFKHSQRIQVEIVISTKSNSQLETLCKNYGIHFENNSFDNLEKVLKTLKSYKTDWIFLAGFLKLVPKMLIEAYPNRIVNIHPSLLPKYGGKGMYGTNVHKAIWNNKEPKSGITFHFVNEQFDEGEIIAQYSTDISDCINIEQIQKKVQTLEHQYYPKVIEQLLTESIL